MEHNAIAKSKETFYYKNVLTAPDYLLIVFCKKKSRIVSRVTLSFKSKEFNFKPDILSFSSPIQLPFLSFKRCRTKKHDKKDFPVRSSPEVISIVEHRILRHLLSYAIATN